METKKTESKTEQFVKAVDSLSTNLLAGEKQGYVLFTYNEEENGQENSFMSRGKINRIAECLFSCMKQNPMLANVVVAASNALVQSRVLESQMKGELPATPEEAKKPKRNKKKLS